MKTRSYVSSCSRAVRRAASASARRTCARSSPSPNASRLALSARSALASRSMNTVRAAPRERASIPSPPAPANTSSTFSEAISPSIANSASLTLSEVGLVVRPLGAFRRLPPNAPAITRTALALGGDRLQCVGAEAARERVAQQRVLGRLQLGIARDDRLRPRAGTLLQFGVVGQTGHAELPKPGLARAHQLAVLAE